MGSEMCIRDSIIHAAGADPLGIVTDVTAFVTEAGGNVGESVAGRLGFHYFSLMMLVDDIPVPLAQQACKSRFAMYRN